MEPDTYEAFNSFARDDDQLELNFDDPDEQPKFEFTESVSKGSAATH